MDPEGLSAEDVADIADMLVMTGRAVEAQKWVPELADAAIEQASRSAYESLLT